MTFSFNSRRQEVYLDFQVYRHLKAISVMVTGCLAQSRLASDDLKHLDRFEIKLVGLFLYGLREANVDFQILCCHPLDLSLDPDRKVYFMLMEFSPYDHFTKVFEVSE